MGNGAQYYLYTALIYINPWGGFAPQRQKPPRWQLRYAAEPPRRSSIAPALATYRRTSRDCASRHVSLDRFAVGHPGTTVRARGYTSARLVGRAHDALLVATCPTPTWCCYTLPQLFMPQPGNLEQPVIHQFAIYESEQAQLLHPLRLHADHERPAIVHMRGPGFLPVVLLKLRPLELH